MTIREAHGAGQREARWQHGPTMNHPVAMLAAATLLLGSLGGCSVFAEAPPCSSDANCRSGESCDPESRTCVVASTDGGTTPTDASGSDAQVLDVPGSDAQLDAASTDLVGVDAAQVDAGAEDASAVEDAAAVDATGADSAIGDASGSDAVGADDRLQQIYDSLDLLAQRKTTPDRAERLLNLFSEMDPVQTESPESGD